MNSELDHEGYETEVQKNAANFLYCQLRFGGHSFVQNNLDALIRFHSKNESWWPDWSGLLADLDEQECMFQGNIDLNAILNGHLRPGDAEEKTLQIYEDLVGKQKTFHKLIFGSFVITQAWNFRRPKSMLNRVFMGIFGVPLLYTGLWAASAVYLYLPFFEEFANFDR